MLGLDPDHAGGEWELVVGNQDVVRYHNVRADVVELRPDLFLSGDAGTPAPLAGGTGPPDLSIHQCFYRTV